MISTVPLVCLIWGSGSKWTFSSVKALNLPAKRVSTTTDTTGYSPHLVARTADSALFHAQKPGKSTADTTRPLLNVAFCPLATERPGCVRYFAAHDTLRSSGPRRANVDYRTARKAVEGTGP